MFSLAVFCLLLTTTTTLVAAKGEGKHRGFNSAINWVNSIDEAKKAAADNGRPIFILIHKSWCGACKALQGVFANSDQIAKRSEAFNMVNLEDDEEPSAEEFKPDGGYIPRIFFMDASGKLDTSVTNKQGNPKYKYFYSSEQQVLSGMDDAIKAFQK